MDEMKKLLFHVPCLPMIAVLLWIALTIPSCVQTREVTLLHELEFPAYTEYNLATAAKDKETMLLHYEVRSFLSFMSVACNI